MELDTGAAISIISEREQRKLYPLTSLHPTHTHTHTLLCYPGAAMPVAGDMTAQVEYGSQRCTLPLILVASNGPAML